MDADKTNRMQEKWRCPECGELHVFPAPEGVGYKDCCLRRSMEKFANDAEEAYQDMSESCPTCGSRCVVLWDDTGSSSYKPTHPAQFKINAQRSDRLADEVQQRREISAALVERIVTLETALADDKARRVYYQNIVYSVCNSLDRIFSTTVKCGTIEEPSNEVQDRVADVEVEFKATQEQTE